MLELSLHKWGFCNGNPMEMEWPFSSRRFRPNLAHESCAKHRLDGDSNKCNYHQINKLLIKQSSYRLGHISQFNMHMRPYVL